MNNNPQGNAQNEDYLDKGLDAAEKKYGGSWGQNTEKNRGVNEKIVCIHLLAFTYTEILTAIDRRRTQHVRKGNWKEGSREGLKLT